MCFLLLDGRRMGCVRERVCESRVRRQIGGVWHNLGSLRSWVRRMRPRRLHFWLVELHHTQCCGENAGLDDLQLNAVREFLCRQARRNPRLIDLLQRFRELSPYANPLIGLEIVVLEEKCERCRTEERGILSEELGFAQLRWLVGWRLCGRIAGDGRNRGWNVCYMRTL